MIIIFLILFNHAKLMVKYGLPLLSHFSRVRLFETPWTAAYQVPPSLGFSTQEYLSRLPLPSGTARRLL